MAFEMQNSNLGCLAVWEIGSWLFGTNLGIEFNF
jgi:hypothetical protein